MTQGLLVGKLLVGRLGVIAVTRNRYSKHAKLTGDLPGRREGAGQQAEAAARGGEELGGGREHAQAAVS